MARKRFEWKVRDQILSLGERTLIVGVLNVTPDSFSDGGEYLDPDRAFAHAIELEDLGADILEIGAESTRPGSTRISEAEELRRLVPVLKRLRGKINIPIAVDTYKAAVAAKALELGASIINDPSALTFDPELARTAVNADAGLILNHMRGTPDTWAKLPPMKNPVPVIVEELSAAVHRAVLVGFDRKRIVIDPGLGFGKRKEQNAEILAQLGGLTRMDLPVMVGPSRKHFLSHIVGQDAAPESTEFATAAAVTAAIMNGAHIVRVHDVKAMKAVVEVADEILRGAYVAEPVEEPAKRPAGKQDGPRESSREGGGYRAGFAARAQRPDPSEQTGRKATGAAAIPVPPIGKRVSRATDAVAVDLSAAKATADEDIRKTKIVAAEEVELAVELDDELDIDDPIELKSSADDDDMEIVLLDDDEDEEDVDDDDDVDEGDDDADDEDADDESDDDDEDQDDDLEIPLDDSGDELDGLEPAKKIAAKKAARNQPIARDPRTKTGSGAMDREGSTRGTYKPAASDRKPDNRKSSFAARSTGSRPERSDDSRGGFPKRTGFAPVRRPDSRPAAGGRSDSRGPSSDRPTFEKRSGPPKRFEGERRFDGPRSGPPRSGPPREASTRSGPPRDRPSRDDDRPRFGAGAGDRGDRPSRGPAGFGSKPFGAKPFNKRPNDADGDSRSEGGSDRPSFKKFGGFKKPFSGRPGSDSDRPRTDRPSTGKPSFGRPPSDRPAGRPSFGKPGTGRPPSGRPPTGRPSSDRPPSGRPSSGRPSSGGRPPSGKPPFRGGKPTSSGSGGKSGSPSGRRGPSGPGRRS